MLNIALASSEEKKKMMNHIKLPSSSTWINEKIDLLICRYFRMSRSKFESRGLGDPFILYYGDGLAVLHLPSVTLLNNILCCHDALPCIGRAIAHLS